jgi:hypothetical protein
MRNFEGRMAVGKEYEDKTRDSLIADGYMVIPLTVTRGREFEGPRAYAAGTSFATPDFICFEPRTGYAFFVEVKSWQNWQWYKATQTYRTGFTNNDLRNYNDIKAMTGLDIWIYIYHWDGTQSHNNLTRGVPDKVCPTGRDIIELSDLQHGISLTRDNSHQYRGVEYRYIDRDYIHVEHENRGPWNAHSD